MRNRIVPIAIVLIVIALCIFGIDNYFADASKGVTAKKVENPASFELNSVVEEGYLENVICFKGMVEPLNESYIEIIDLDLTDGSICTSVMYYGKDIVPGDELYILNGRAEKAKSAGKVVDYRLDSNSLHMEVLHYENLCIAAGLNYSYLGQIKPGSQVKIREINELVSKDETDESVLKIGYEVNENNVQILLSNNSRLLPGTEVNLTYTYQSSEKSMYILKQMLQEDGAGYYVYIDTSDGRIRKNVTIGKTFTSIYKDTRTEFVEIISGLNVGEKLVIDIVQN